MSVQAITFVLGVREQSRWTLEPHPSRLAERLVMISLANHASSDRFECWPSLATIAAEAQLKDEEAARVVLRRLEEKGWVEILLHGAPDHRIRADRRPNLYRLLDDGRIGSFHPARHDPRCDRGPQPTRPPAPPGHDPRPAQGVTVIGTVNPSSSSSTRSTEPPISPEEEDQDDPDPVTDDLVAEVADRLLADRNADLPDQPVRQRTRWLAKARRELRRDPNLPRAAAAVRHPALGLAHREDARSRQVEALVHVHRTASWPIRPAPRRLVEPADGVHIVDTPDRTPMPTSVRDALTGGPRR